MAPRVLISDALSPSAVAIFNERGIVTDFEPGLGQDKNMLAAVIGDFDRPTPSTDLKVWCAP